jgi:hypothetical protein
VARAWRAMLLGFACAVGALLAGSGLARADTATNAAQVVAWANQHAGDFGIDPQTLTVALLASGFYESGLQDVPNGSGSGAQGPFQFYGPTLATAQAEGFNIHTVAGSLNAFAVSGGLWLGVQAYGSATALGAGESVALHTFYLALERPGAGEDAVRYARGDWAQAVAFAFSASGTALAPPPPANPDLGTTLSSLAAAASRAARAGSSGPTHWPSGAVGPPGRFLGDAMVDANGVLYLWDGSTWVAAAHGRPSATTS